MLRIGEEAEAQRIDQRRAAQGGLVQALDIDGVEQDAGGVERLGREHRHEQRRVAGFLRRLSAPLLMVSNEGDVVDQVRRLLGMPARGS